MYVCVKETHLQRDEEATYITLEQHSSTGGTRRSNLVFPQLQGVQFKWVALMCLDIKRKLTLTWNLILKFVITATKLWLFPVLFS